MEIIASDLKQKLDNLNAIVTSKGLVENCDKFVFNKNTIFAFNGDIFTSVDFKTDLKGAIIGDSFYKIVEKHGANKIILEQDGENLVVKKGRSKSVFAFDSDVECPIKIKVKEWNPLPENFLEAVNNCSYTTGKDYTDMRTVCIHVKKKTAESSDSYRMTVFNLDSKINDELFIPNNMMRFFNRCKPIKYSKGKNWIYYMDLNGTIICHADVSFSEEYPDLREIIESADDYKELELPEKLYDSLEKAAIFLESKIDQDRYVSIKCAAGKLKIESNGNSGKYSETLKVKFKEEISFDVHPAYMMEAIEKSSKIFINDSTIKITGANSVNLLCLTEESKPEEKEASDEDE